MKNIAPILIIVAIAGLVLWLIFKPRATTQPLGGPQGWPAPVSFTAQQAAATTTGTVDAPTLAKIQIACMAPTSKNWFEQTYKVPCSRFGF